MVADKPDVIANTLHVTKKGVEFGATDHAIDTLARTWIYTLDWVGKHPYLFVITLIFLGFWLVQRRIGSVQAATQKAEYDERRLANQSPPLPLPSPTQPSKMDR